MGQTEGARGRTREWLGPLVVLVIVAGIAVTLLATGGTPRLPTGSPSSQTQDEGFADSATVEEELLSGLDAMPVAESALQPLFTTGAQPAEPHRLYVPPLARTSATTRSLGASAALIATDFIDLRTDTGVPQEFVDYTSAGVTDGLARWDELYPDARFSFQTAARARHFRVFITTNRAPFEALVHTTVFRHGFVEPCANAPVSNRSDCVPEVRVYFEASKWDGNTYAPMTRQRVAHEVFHVGHIYLLRALGKADLFQASGYYWQTESFATFSQRMLPDPTAYESTGMRLLNESYFAWPALTDAQYERAYEAVFLADEAVFRTGDDPRSMTRWLAESQAGVTSSLTFMRIVAGDGAGNVDLNKFQKLYVRSLVDLRFPGLLKTQTDPRTIGAAGYDSTQDGKLDATALPLRISASVPVIGQKILRAGVVSLPDAAKVPTLQIGLAASGKVRAVVLAVRGDDTANIDFCYQVIGNVPAADRVEAAKACIQKHARPIGVLDSTKSKKLTVKVQALKNFSPDLSKLRFVAMLFGLADQGSLDAGTPPAPIDATLSINKESEETPTPSATPRANIELRGHLVSAGYSFMYCEHLEGPNVISDLKLRIDYTAQRVTGRCDIREPALGSDFNPILLTFDVEGTVDSQGNIRARLLNGHVRREAVPGESEAFDWIFSGTFDGTVDATGRAQGIATYVITKRTGGSGAREEPVSSQWAARP